jgi:hypothetical protein
MLAIGSISHGIDGSDCLWFALKPSDGRDNARASEVLWEGTPGNASMRHVLVAALLFVSIHQSAAAAAGCFRACLSGRVTSSDDDVVMRDAMRACRDQCTKEESTALMAEGIYHRYATCRPKPVSEEEFRRVRSANPAFTVQINVLVWELNNPLPDKVIRSVEIATQTMSLSDAAFTTRTVIPPGRTGTIVVMDFFDGYPGARFANKLTRVEACPVE